MKLLSERFALIAARLEASKAALGAADDDGCGGSEVVNVETTQKWLDEQVEYIKMTSTQLVVSSSVYSRCVGALERKLMSSFAGLNGGGIETVRERGALWCCFWGRMGGFWLRN